MECGIEVGFRQGKGREGRFTTKRTKDTKGTKQRAARGRVGLVV